MLAFISPFMIPLAVGAIGLDYLRRQLFPPAPSTEPVGSPYVPPYKFGQCVGVPYRLYFQNPINETFHISQASASFGAIKSLAYQGYIGGIHYWQSVDANDSVQTHSYSNSVQQPTLIEWRRVDGLVDTCGDAGDPNPKPPVSGDGLANSAAPNMSGDPTLVLGAPLATIPSLAALLAALANALANAATTLDALKKLMDALKAIGDALDAIKDWLDEKDKDDDKKKDLKKHDYGSISKDGFLKLYPNGEKEGFKPEYIDLQLLNIPVSYGKFFGSLSPNFYRFDSLGYISFVSPSFGILETQQIEFTRKSLNVPPNAYGFFYHLGLNGVIKANVTLFYLESKEEE